MRLVIIGGGAGGASCAARARRLNNTAEIIILEKTNEVSIANCGLPYYCGGIIKDRAVMQVAAPQTFTDLFNIDLRLNTDVTALDPAAKTVATQNGDTIAYDKLVLATGAAPFVPPIKGLETASVFTVRHLFDADRIKQAVAEKSPRSAAVIGGGFVGVEMAESLHALGLKTALIEQADQVLAPLDQDMVPQLQTCLRENGIQLFLKDGVAEIRSNEIVLNSGKTVPADLIILAIGVRPQTHLAEQAGMAVGLNKAVKVNEFMQTNIDDIYACGDGVEVKDFVTGHPTLIPLAGPANRQGRLIADHIFGRPYPYTGTQGSGIVKVFAMTAAFTGNNEKQLKAKNIPYEKMIIWASSHAGYYPASTPLALKVLYNTAGKILGAQAVGYEGVDKRIDVIAAIMRLNGTVYDLRDAELCYAPPYSSAKDPVNLAGMAIQNVLEKRIRPFFGTDFNGLFVVDVRPPKAYEKSHLPTAVNIPAAQIKKRLNELPRDKPILLHCFKGYTSYVAGRILLQNGFSDVYSYAGGLQQYEVETAGEKE